MNKETAIAALQSIDAIVYKSSHQELSPDETGELRIACRRLIHSIQDNVAVTRKAAWIVELIQAAVLKDALKPGANPEEILECGITLALFIQQQPDDTPARADDPPAE